MNNHAFIAPGAPSNRLIAIDIFRGLTMVMMIFVNDIAFVKGLPFWMYHIRNEPILSYVDAVFPTFLFIVGLSIPLAIDRRLSQGDSRWRVLWHVLVRSLSLLILGVLKMNGNLVNAEATGMPANLWRLGMFVAIFLLWNRYPRAQGWKLRTIYGLQILGCVILTVLVVLFRRGKAEDITWCRTDWWGILGLIGWTYLGTSVYYLLCKRHLLGMLVVFSALVSLAHFVCLKSVTVPPLIAPLLNWVLTPVTMAGAITSIVLRHPVFANPWKRIGAILGWAGFLYTMGFLFLEHGYGGGTPSWTLFCSALAATLFALIFYVSDIKHWTRWALLFKPAGSNTLTTYFLPEIAYALLGLSGLSLDVISNGGIGLVRSIGFTLLMLACAWFVSRCHIRLRL